VLLHGDERPDIRYRDSLSEGASEDAEKYTLVVLANPPAEIQAQGYDVSLNRYREIVHDDVEHRPPLEIVAELEKVEHEIQAGLAGLRRMLSCRRFR
jgi:type I restriction enzyme M protein